MDIGERIENEVVVRNVKGYQGQEPKEVGNSAAFLSVVRTVEFESQIVAIPVFPIQDQSLPLRHTWFFGEYTLEAELVGFGQEKGVFLAAYEVGIA